MPEHNPHGDTCTHRGGALSEGTLAGEEVFCAWHGAKFNVETGKAITNACYKRSLRRLV